MGRPSKGPHLYEREGLIYVRDGDFRRTTDCRVGQEAEANKVLARYILGQWPGGAEFAAQAPVTGECKDRTIVECLIAYDQQVGQHSASAHSVRLALLHVAPRVAGLTTASMLPRHWQALFRELRDDVGLAHGTAFNHVWRLQTALNWCKANRLIETVPESVLPPPPEARELALTRGEVARVWLAVRACVPRYKRFEYWALNMMALYTGRRVTAIRTLEWAPNPRGGHVNLARGIIDFRRQGQPESKKRRGWIAIPRRLLFVLRRLKARQQDRYVFPATHSAAGLGNYGRTWRRVRRHAGLDHIHFHDWGHTCASWKADAGVPIHRLSKWIAKSPRTLMKVYVNVTGEGRDVGDI